MLYQVATGLLSADEIAAPIRSLLHRQRNTEVLMAEVSGVDVPNRHVLMGEKRLSYDYLILATGIRYNYFAHPEWEEFAPGLTSVGDADRIRAKILEAFEEAEKLAADPHTDRCAVQSLLTFVLVGGGPTGVEMAGSIAELARTSLAGDFRHIDPRAARILLFEAGPRILPAFPAELAEKSRRRLEQMGVEVRTGAAVQAVDAEGVVVGGERIDSRTVLWAAGVVATPAGRWLGAELDRAGRVKVTSDLSVTGHPKLFVIGDTAAVVAPTRNLFGVKEKEPQPLPGLAAPALQEGLYVAQVIQRREQGRPPPAPFCYKDKGNLAIVGRSFAIADLKVLRFSGLFAWLLWLGVHIFFLIGFGNRLLVMLQWAISYVTNRRGVRIVPTADEEAHPAPSGRAPAGAVRQEPSAPPADGSSTLATGPPGHG
jgi:NADH dehydrogenase